MSEANQRNELSHLVDLDQWTFILNRFSEVLGVDIYTVDRTGKPITRPQHSPKIWGLVAAAKDPSRLRFKSPSELIQRLILKSRESGSSVEMTTPLGFTQALIPIFSEPSKILAYLVVGPLLLGTRKAPAELASLTSEQGWSPLELEGTYQELKLVSFVGMKAMLDLLSEVCNYLVEPSTLKGGHEQILSEFTSSWRKDLGASPSLLDNFFMNLLDLALRATKADSGSVMTVDPQSHILRIRVAHGLDREVVQKTELKMGEGVAGWVAERNQPLLIDSEAPLDRSLQDRLTRREIDSSIVMPLARQKEVLGVLSINSHDKKNRLKPQSLDLLTQLAKLTMVVLQSL